MVQGACRYERVFAYVQYLESTFPGIDTPFVSVPGVAHDGCLMYTSPEARALFSPYFDFVETTGQTLECGSTMEECNQAYLDASSVTCTTAEPASLYTPTNSGLTETATPASNWMFNQQNNNGEVQLALGL